MHRVGRIVRRWWKRYSCSMRSHRFFKTVVAYKVPAEGTKFRIGEWCLQCDDER